MTIKLTWTPGQLATTQTIQYRIKDTTSWSTYTTVDNSTSVVFVTLPDGAYDFRIVSDCDACTCPEGYTLNESGNCIKTDVVPVNATGSTVQVTRTPLSVYGSSGTAVHTAALDPQVYTTLSFDNPFWLRQPIPNFSNLTPEQKQAAELDNGPVNRLAVWGVQLDPNGVPYNNYTIGFNSLPPTNTWIGFDVCINIETTKTYYVGIAADNGYRLILDGQLLLEDVRNDPEVFNFLHIYPVTISAGSHILRLEAINYQGNAGFGCEVFDLDNRGSLSVVEFLNQQTNYNNLNVIFTTRGATQFNSNLFTCPTGYTLANPNCTQLVCSRTLSTPCTPIDASSNIFDVAAGCQPPNVGVVTLTPESVPPPPPPSPTDPPPVDPPFVQCLTGLILEFMYFHKGSDFNLLPSGYTMPCPGAGGVHECNRAFFEVFANNVYIGDANMNNDGNGLFGLHRGVKTRSGKYTCEDEKNRPRALRPNNIWTGSRKSRYARIDITTEQAREIARLSNTNQFALRLIPAMVTYNFDCSRVGAGPHTEVTWFRVTRPDGQLLYSGCPVSYAATIEVPCTQSND